MNHPDNRNIENRQSSAANTIQNDSHRLCRILTGLLIFLVTIPIYSQEQILEPLLFDEQIRQNAPVAGEIFMGVHLGKIDYPANLNTLSVVIPPGDFAHLCLKIETQDSKYYAEATFDISRHQAGRKYRVHLPTKHRQLLESTPIRDISILAYVSKACDDTDKIYIPVQLQDINSSDSQIMLLINSQEPSVDVRVYYLEENRYYTCQMDSISERQVAFNRECLLDPVKNGNHLTLIVVRNRFQYRMEDIKIEVYLP